eukprot:CAMPEP_0194135694 /NCGR_PEP_ID=MMETSP0152-20130528/5782_1 /TAXON_ID=1049557 /ORGANISM="Thalassiothrix antarctica, Strain L6-D1" /LENGTH=405 /DNA_ID=CAMNT_0038832047 /DNA_START=242 /DNA_END=1459 /DNA_ORIENTATION=-
MNGDANINELGADKNSNNTGVETPTKGTPENGILTPEQKSASENDKKRKTEDGDGEEPSSQKKKRKNSIGGSANKKGSPSKKKSTPKKRLPTSVGDLSKGGEETATAPSEVGESKEKPISEEEGEGVEGVEGEEAVVKAEEGAVVKQEEGAKQPPRKIYKRRKTFDERLQALANYKEKYGDCYVPHKFKDDRSLGDWVKDVRRGHLKITKDQRKLLNAIGFVWETRYNRREREWNAILEKLTTYKERFGDCRVPWKYDEDPSLSEWVRTQRKLNKKGNLREDRKKALDIIGFLWLDGKINPMHTTTLQLGTMASVAAVAEEAATTAMLLPVHHQHQHPTHHHHQQPPQPQDLVLTTALKTEEDNVNNAVAVVQQQQQQWEVAAAAAHQVVYPTLDYSQLKNIGQF